MSSANSRTILIVDDAKVNRLILREMLDEDYQVLEACDGNEAIDLIREHVEELSLILLDIVMPGMDGFQVLSMMNRYHWTDSVPVIVISADDSDASINKCYKLGATDYIRRPFDYTIVSNRVANTITLFERQNRLIHLVEEQIYEKEQNSSLMISVLAQVVEFRNGESGMHVHHIQTMTAILLQHLVQMTNRYQLTPGDILRISTASALHDIGKITIDEKILNKPGRLTNEEFAIMKTHSMAGANILQAVPTDGHTELLNTAYQICRWHHERYDGRGYPDGLVGDAIPIAAQVVSLADVYDALTSDRCYKKAIPHEEAIRMIQNGECGAFSPLLLRCLDEVQDQLKEQLNRPIDGSLNHRLLSSVTRSILSGHRSLHHNSMIGSAYDWRALEFFTSGSKDLFLIYDDQSHMLNLSPISAEFFGVSQSIADPTPEQLPFISADELAMISEAVKQATQDHPDFELTLQLKSPHISTPVACHISGRVLWSEDGIAPVQTGYLMKGRLEI